MASLSLEKKEDLASNHGSNNGEGLIPIELERARERFSKDSSG
jgi:hypothetical protein